MLKSKYSTITTSNKTFFLNEKPFFMYSGEIHYFRIPEKLWRIHILKARRAGLNTVSSYIPWSWHEYKEGHFDFNGATNPQRNLLKFMRLIKENGLYFSARVGPVSNAEMIGEGIPPWLLNKNTEIFIQKNGTKIHPNTVILSYLNPTFQSYVKKWYDQLLPIVSQWQIHNGGNIILVQLCNEIGMIHWLSKGFDESEYVNRMYQDFLREKYNNDLSSLNNLYSSDHKTFQEIRQPVGAHSNSDQMIAFDWALFYRYYYAQYYKALYGVAKSHGVSVPHSANAPQFYDYDVRGRGVFSPMTTSLFRDFSSQAPSTVFGGAYQMRRLDFENFHDIAITSEITKILDPDAATICAELQTGIMRDRPRLYPADVDLNIKSSVAHGLNGINCYMFSSGQNSTGMGSFGSYHDWQAPVSLNGVEKKHILPLKEWGRFIKKYGTKLADTSKVNDTTVGFYLPYYATEYLSESWSDKVEFLRNHYFFDGFARLLQLAGFNFSFCDIMKLSREELSRFKSLCFFSLENMDEETQKKLADYVFEGGKLLIGPKMPSQNLSGKPCTIFRDALEISYNESRQKDMIIWHGNDCAVDFPIHTFNGNRSHSVLKTTNGSSCVVSGQSGRGRWLVYGFGLSHSFDYQVQIVREWMDELGIKPHTQTDPWDLQAVVRWKDDHGFLFVFNYHDVSKKGNVTLNLDGIGKVSFFFKRSIQLQNRSAAIIPLKNYKGKITEA